MPKYRSVNKTKATNILSYVDEGVTDENKAVALAQAGIAYALLDVADAIREAAGLESADERS